MAVNLKQTLTEDGKLIQNDLFGITSEPSAFFTNFMNTIPPIKYSTAIDNTLKETYHTCLSKETLKLKLSL